jgi:uncharacterized membrane protein
MPADIPITPDPSLPSHQPGQQAPGQQEPGQHALDEIQRQLHMLAARMDRAENRLGIQSQSPVISPSQVIRRDAPASAPFAATPTAPPVPIADPLPRVVTSAPPVAMPPIAPPVTSQPTSTPPSMRAPIAASVSGNPTMENPITVAESIVNSIGATRTRISGSGADKKLLGDWENLIGGKWALWVGLLSLFLAVAYFLAYTWKSLPPMPPAARVACGIAAGAALIGAGGFFRTRTQRWFSEGLAGAGLAVLYLSFWAGAQQYHLLSFGTAFTAMGLTTVLGVYLAIRFDALSLSILATLGGFLTPLLLHGKGVTGSELLHRESLSLLTYVAVLNAGILAVSLFKRWNSLTWLSFIATVLLIGSWAIDDYSIAQRWPTFAYFTIYFLLFVGTSCFYSLARREETAQPDLLLLFAATSTYSLAGHALLNGALGTMPGTFALALALFFGFLCSAVKLLAPGIRTLRQSTGGLALLFLTVAIPIQYQQQGLAIGWCVEAAVLLILGLRLQASLLQRAGQTVWCLSLVPLLGVLLDVAPKPPNLFLNDRALPLLLSLLATALVVAQHWVMQKASNGESNDSRQEPSDRPALLDALAPLYASYVVLGGAWLLAQESYLWFSWHKWPNPGTWHAGALYIISGLLALYAAAAFAIGLKGRDMAVRLSAMAVTAVAMTLPIWTGLVFSTTGWTPFWNLRWLSYIIIALALAAIGWMMQRDPEAFTSEEAQTSGVWLAAVSLFALMGMTIETYCGFGRGALPTDGDWRAGAFFAIAILWGVFAASLIHLSYAWRQAALRMTALAVGGGASLLLVIVSIGYSGLDWAPLFNLRALAFAVTVSLSAVIAMGENRHFKASGHNGGLASTAVLAALLSACLLIWGLTQESYNTFDHFQKTFGPHWKLIAFFFISVLWSAGMWVLLRVGVQRSLVLFRVVAYELAVLAGALSLWAALDTTRLGWLPLFNARCGAFVLVALLLAACSALLGRYRDSVTEWEQQMGAILGWAAGALLLWGITQEVYETCFYHRQVLGSHWVRWAQMVVSLAWSVYGAALLVGGINRNFQPLRLAALGLLAVTVLKVFLFDLGFLSGPLRMFSLAGLGLALIFISWLYGRYARNGDAGSGDMISPLVATE